MVPTEPSPGTVSYRGSGQHQADGGAVIWLAGDQDISTVAALIETMARVIAIDDADLVVDASGVQSMCAPTVEVLARARDYLRARSRSLTLRSPAACVARALERCGPRTCSAPTPQRPRRPARSGAGWRCRQHREPIARRARPRQGPAVRRRGRAAVAPPRGTWRRRR